MELKSSLEAINNTIKNKEIENRKLLETVDTLKGKLKNIGNIK